MRDLNFRKIKQIDQAGKGAILGVRHSYSVRQHYRPYKVECADSESLS